ncbi:type II toxin-antitoxin system RelE/ParE family toxin [Gluconobacter cerinus]|uniref:type II toxin-antitoxin system RelE family toxin n=1 Tax=Gluconobacter cerinus TaxID=38307 RepID=UPI001B8CF824|nr:type II toxin-antitoxin system RelE/ParE family toxin [Gluconobacter cerinus]MBS0984564.1 type II toxin-antitoxin system RelE/ParE family toxin [Gluconobacter cerinus]MBS0984571.1 type II toxin-antitoxin system RelE/ParE family toxin [Gluconobacter cerinus]
MSYSLDILQIAEDEFFQLEGKEAEQFSKKLTKILENPHIRANKLRGMPNCYKIKLRAAGVRGVYQVNDQTVTVLLVAVGKREDSEAYDKAKQRI